MADLHNIFISHYGEDEKSLDSLKQRLRDHGCDVRNSSVEKKKYRPYKVTDATIARYLRLCIRWAKTFIVMKVSTLTNVLGLIMRYAKLLARAKLLWVCICMVVKMMWNCLGPSRNMEERLLAGTQRIS